MKKVFLVLMIFLMAIGLIACTGKDENTSSSLGTPNSSTAEYKDGKYTVDAEQYDEKDYKATVTINITEGKISSVDCDEKAKDGSSKKALSESGQYGMKEKGGSQGEWHEEVALLEKAVTQNGIQSISLNGDGKADSITGCTISINKFVTLIEKSLEKAKK